MRVLGCGKDLASQSDVVGSLEGLKSFFVRDFFHIELPEMQLEGFTRWWFFFFF